MFQRLRYFSVAVTSLEEAIQNWVKLFGLQVMTPPYENEFGFRAAILGNGNEALIELIQPSDPDGALARFMKERAIPSNPNGEGIYLVGIAVDDINKAIQQIQEQGGRITQNELSPNMAWVHPTTSNFAFMELAQVSP